MMLAVALYAQQPAKAPAQAKGKAAPAKTEAAKPAKNEAAKPAPADSSKVKANTSAATNDSTKQASSKPVADTAKTAAATTKTDSSKADTAKVAPADSSKAKADTAKVASDTAKVTTDSSKVNPEADRFATIKKRKHKIAYGEYMDKKLATRDSLAAITYHHGFTFAGARLTDKRLGDLDADNTWGGSGAIYYYYRMYFNQYIGFQARLGGVIRYSRFNVEEPTSKIISYKGKAYTIAKDKEVHFTNTSIDIPLTVKFGNHLDPTTFVYASLTAGVTKSVYEKIKTETTLFVENPSKELASDLEFLENNGYFDPEDHHTTAGAFKFTDIEANSWIGVGFETRYIGFNYQLLIAACSLEDNHRYKDMFHNEFPSWRLMIDFSLR